MNLHALRDESKNVQALFFEVCLYSKILMRCALPPPRFSLMTFFGHKNGLHLTDVAKLLLEVPRGVLSAASPLFSMKDLERLGKKRSSKLSRDI